MTTSTTEPRQPWGESLRVRSYLAMDEGDCYFVVSHRDNSDAGRGEHYFESRDDALAYADRIRSNPPQGNAFHPAPAVLNVQVFTVERLA
jgi:hypothetical protein